MLIEYLYRVCFNLFYRIGKGIDRYIMIISCLENIKGNK